MNVMLLIKFSSAIMQGNRKLCECHTRFFRYQIFRVTVQSPHSQQNNKLIDDWNESDVHIVVCAQTFSTNEIINVSFSSLFSIIQPTIFVRWKYNIVKFGFILFLHKNLHFKFFGTILATFVTLYATFRFFSFDF